MHRCIPCTIHVLLWDNCAVFNWVLRERVPQQLELMRSLSVIIAMLVSSTVMGQACGLFGLIDDNQNNPYVGRFDQTLDYVTLESALTCEEFVCEIEVIDVRRGRRWTRIHMVIDDTRFNGGIYVIKYPTGSWIQHE